MILLLHVPGKNIRKMYQATNRGETQSGNAIRSVTIARSHAFILKCPMLSIIFMDPKINMNKIKVTSFHIKKSNQIHNNSSAISR